MHEPNRSALQQGRGGCRDRSELQAALAVNRLGPCAAARARINRFLNARCSTYTTTPHFLSLKSQNCDPTCTSPATGRSGTHSGPGNTTRQILTIHTVTHMANVAPVPTLSISMLKHGADALRCLPMRMCCSRRQLQQPRRCPCSCRPTGRAPMSRPAGRLKDTPTGAGRTAPGGRMAATTTRLASGCCIAGLVQLPPTAARSAAKPPYIGENWRSVLIAMLTFPRR